VNFTRGKTHSTLLIHSVEETWFHDSVRPRNEVAGFIVWSYILDDTSTGCSRCPQMCYSSVDKIDRFEYWRNEASYSHFKLRKIQENKRQSSRENVNCSSFHIIWSSFKFATTIYLNIQMALTKKNCPEDLNDIDFDLTFKNFFVNNIKYAVYTSILRAKQRSHQNC
jgi:flagellar basal body rod protein FlgB